MDRYANHVINMNYFRMIDQLDENEKKFFMSKSGKNLGYSAEIMARYISQDRGYVEVHKALEDSLIEYELALFFFQHWKYDYFEKYHGQISTVHWSSIRDRLSSAEKERQREINFGGDLNE